MKPFTARWSCLLLGMLLSAVSCSITASAQSRQETPAFIRHLPFQVLAYRELPGLDDRHLTQLPIDERDLERTPAPRPYPLEGNSISPSGRFVFRVESIDAFYIPEDQPRYDISVYDTSNGKWRHIDLLAQFHTNVIDNIFWDPTDDRYLFISAPETRPDGGTRITLWRMRIGGTTPTRISREDESVSWGQPTPDGESILLAVTPFPVPKEATEPVWYLQSRQDPAKRELIMWPAQLKLDKYHPPVFAPNMRLIARVASVEELQMANLAAPNWVTMLSKAQLEIKHEGSANFGYFGWFADSSGGLLSVNHDCYITTDGQAVRLLKGVYFSDVSDNGLHWVFNSQGKTYLVTAQSSTAGAPGAKTR